MFKENNSPPSCFLEKLPLPLCMDIILIQEKTCTKCGITKPRTDFPKKFSKAEGKTHRVKPHCKECDYKRQRKRIEDYRIVNPEARPKRINGINIHKQNLQWVVEYKEASSCVDCGMLFKDKSCCCDFHHVDPTTKDFAVSEMIKHVGDLNLIKQEVAKCITLCANCHRLRHWKGT